MAKITIQQFSSPIRRHKKQRLFLGSLGLKKIGDIRILEDQPGVRSLVRKLAHMVRIVEEASK